MKMMKSIDAEAVFNERICRRWRDRGCNPSFATRISYASLLILIIFAPIVVSRPSNDAKENVNNPDLELEHLAFFYMNSLDRNSQPCDDFYAFACRNLMAEYGKENRYRFDTMSMMEKRTRVALDNLLTKPFNTSDSATLRQMKIFQQMCSNKSRVETEGIEPVLAVLDEMGGWPLLTSDSGNNESWEQIVGNVNRAGFATAFPFFLVFDATPSNASSMTMVLEPLLDPDRLRVLPKQNRTVEYVKRVASLLNSTNDRIDDDIKSCIEFESELYKLTYTTPPDYVTYTLNDLLISHPQISWKSFFRNIFLSTNVAMSSNESILFSHSEYNVKISGLLNKTSPRIVRNYVVWQLIVASIPLMPEKFREAKNAFEQRTVGQSRNLDCVDALISKARVSVGYLYIKNFFDGLAKNKSRDMIKSIESEAYRFLKNITWMDDDTHTKLIDRLKNLEMLVPQPNDNIDVMETLEFDSNDTIFANYRRLAEAHRNLKYRRLRMSPETNRKIIPIEFAASAEAWYLSSTHQAAIMAAILQRPFFSTSQPMYLNYGGIGLTMAHEMTHGLEILSVCDSEECPSFDRFQERKECVKKLYGGYLFKRLNKKVDGQWTLEENVGDLIGLKLAYRAYEEFAKDTEEPLLPNLNYTARQWFWINAATSFCSYESDAALRNTIANDRHSPAKARVNVPLANTEEFSRDFQCPIGSPMNPAQKCEFEGVTPPFQPPARKWAFERLKPSVHLPHRDEL